MGLPQSSDFFSAELQTDFSGGQTGALGFCHVICLALASRWDALRHFCTALETNQSSCAQLSAATRAALLVRQSGFSCRLLFPHRSIDARAMMEA